ncbi:MAG: TonB-dependent receptor, partial [Vicinamibacterales bacterium]
NYRRNALQVGGELLAVAAQNRVGGAEEPTSGYNLLKLFSSYSFTSGETVHTVTLRLDNVTSQLYRNHLSLIKEVVPEAGRNLKALYSLSF